MTIGIWTKVCVCACDEMKSSIYKRTGRRSFHTVNVFGALIMHHQTVHINCLKMFYALAVVIMMVTVMRTTHWTLIATCCCHCCKLSSISQLSGCQEGNGEKNTHHLNRLLTRGREMSGGDCSLVSQLQIWQTGWRTWSMLERYHLNRSCWLKSTLIVIESFPGLAAASGSSWPLLLTAKPAPFGIYGVPVWVQGTKRLHLYTINLCHFKSVSLYYTAFQSSRCVTKGTDVTWRKIKKIMLCLRSAHTAAQSVMVILFRLMIISRQIFLMVFTKESREPS